MRISLALIGTLLAAGIPATSASAAICQKGTTSWTNPNGGAWKSEANWSNGLPSKNCDAKITLVGDDGYGVVLGTKTGAGGVARSVTVGAASGGQSLVIDNSVCGTPPCDFDPRLIVGPGGIKVNPTGAIKMYAGRVASAGPIRLNGGRMYGAGTVTAKRGVFNI